ncbi:hypothetical protein EVAR_24927_1 [Eumeta japonica]|uniref:Uncharacterized protein n=1 Tax=Eumeta variegata TaxID=151549 RepID=A0A4C1V5A3_EUMVA|nr:hypothetical protein EVAR_24927_1 [Eumeta japonica]
MPQQCGDQEPDATSYNNIGLGGKRNYIGRVAGERCRRPNARPSAPLSDVAPVARVGPLSRSRLIHPHPSMHVQYKRRALDREMSRHFSWYSFLPAASGSGDKGRHIRSQKHHNGCERSAAS